MARRRSGRPEWARPKREKKENPKLPPSPSRCKDCGAERAIPRYSYFRAKRPTCVECGGLMEYLGGWQGTKSRGKR